MLNRGPLRAILTRMVNGDIVSLEKFQPVMNGHDKISHYLVTYSAGGRRHQKAVPVNDEGAPTIWSVMDDICGSHRHGL